jgi:hypothetical protein
MLPRRRISIRKVKRMSSMMLLRMLLKILRSWLCRTSDTDLRLQVVDPSKLFRSIYICQFLYQGSTKVGQSEFQVIIDKVGLSRQTRCTSERTFISSATDLPFDGRWAQISSSTSILTGVHLGCRSSRLCDDSM